MATLRPQLGRSDVELRDKFANLSTSSDVAALLEVPPRYLKRILTSRSDRERYTEFHIPKSAGGTRRIDVPPKALRILQEKLNYILQLTFRPKPAVHGFVRERSILTNATAHIQKRWVLNIDLEDFFPSIHLGRIRGAFMARPYFLPPYVATAIAQICTRRDGVLPQGAPTSPFISNIICSRLDGQMMALAKRYGLTYTRYCDDITLSSRQSGFPSEIALRAGSWLGTEVSIGDALLQVISANGFAVNEAKTRLQFRGSRQEVTGVIVNQFPNVSREYVRSVRGVLYAWKKHGRLQAARELAKRTGYVIASDSALESHFSAVVRGRLEYIGYIRGRRDPIYCNLRNTLHAIEPTLIPAARTPNAYRILQHAPSGDRWSRLYDRWRNGIGLLEAVVNGDHKMGTAFSIADHELVTAAHNLVGTVSLHATAGPIAITEGLLHTSGRIGIDAALVPIPRSGRLPPLQVDRRMPFVGEPIAIIGFASVPRRHPTLGIYTGIVESISSDYSNGVDLIQVSVQSSGGLSGSPMFDSRGRVLGVVVESTYERTHEDVPGREFFSVLPIRHALDIRLSPVHLAL